MNASAENLIASILLSIFGTAGDLRRFARSHFGEKVLHMVDKASSGTQYAFDLVRALSKARLIDKRFFDALHKQRPDLKATIDQAREDYLGGSLPVMGQGLASVAASIGDSIANAVPRKGLFKHVGTTLPSVIGKTAQMPQIGSALAAYPKPGAALTSLAGPSVSKQFESTLAKRLSATAKGMPGPSGIGKLGAMPGLAGKSVTSPFGFTQSKKQGAASAVASVAANALGPAASRALGKSLSTQLGASVKDLLGPAAVKKLGGTVSDQLGSSLTRLLTTSASAKLRPASLHRHLGASLGGLLGPARSKELGASLSRQFGASVKNLLGPSLSTYMGSTVSPYLLTPVSKQVGADVTDALGTSMSKALGSALSSQVGTAIKEVLGMPISDLVKLPSSGTMSGVGTSQLLALSASGKFKSLLAKQLGRPVATLLHPAATPAKTAGGKEARKTVKKTDRKPPGPATAKAPARTTAAKKVHAKKAVKKPARQPVKRATAVGKAPSKKTPGARAPARKITATKAARTPAKKAPRASAKTRAARKAPPKKARTTRPAKVARRVVPKAPLIHITLEEVEQAQRRARWQAKLAGLFSRQEKPPALDTGWVDAAAVLPWFNSISLQPVPGKRATQKDALVRLAALCDVRPDGQWALKLEPRQASVARLYKKKQLLAALDANPGDPDTPHAGMLRQIAQAAEGQMLVPSYDQLTAAKEINDWFKQSAYTPYDPDKLAADMERQRQIQPLRRLTAQFRGRRAELHMLDQHRRGMLPAPILSLSGKGGVGKSALMGHFLLELERSSEVPTPPWAYLDFDDPELDCFKPRKMIEIATRQLSLLLQDKRLISLEGLSSIGPPLYRATPARSPGSVRGGNKAAPAPSEVADEAVLLTELDLIVRDDAQSSPPALLLVLDTFEQVQVRGTAAVASVRVFLDLLLKHLPYARVIISGRAPVLPLWPGVNPQPLADLDKESADAVLEALQVADPVLRSVIIDQFGTSPLSLRLAADALQRGTLNASDMEAVGQEMKDAERQGYLYTRILGHIKDGEVRRLAHPGLMVRRITVEVIRRVLSPICDLPPEHAEAIFNRLPDQVALFEPDVPGPDGEAALRHRQDLRELMLRRMLEDPEYAEKMPQVHQAAASYYQDSQHPAHRAEEIYHHLMLDAESAILDPLWPPTLDDATLTALSFSLGRCWDEPLPEQSRQWLGVRLGLITVAASGSRNTDLNRPRTVLPYGQFYKGGRFGDVAYETHRTARSLLNQGQAAAALSMINEAYPDGPPADSPLVRLKLRALFQAGMHADARVQLKSVLSQNNPGDLGEQLDLLLMGMELTMQDAALREEFMDHARNAWDLVTRWGGNDLSRLKVLEARARYETLHGERQAMEQSQQALAAEYTTSPEDQLRKEPELTRRIVRVSQSPAVLLKAALTFGNLPEQAVLKTDPVELAALIERVLSFPLVDAPTGSSAMPLEGQSATPADQRALYADLFNLAKQLGLSLEDTRSVEMHLAMDLAAAAVRYSRMGDLIAIVLRHAGEARLVNDRIKELFLPPASHSSTPAPDAHALETTPV